MIWHEKSIPLDTLYENRESIPRKDEIKRPGASIGRSKKYLFNTALMINPHEGNVSLQFHIIFDKKIETIFSLCSSLEPKRWNWLAYHQCEFNANGSIRIIDNTKT